MNTYIVLLKGINVGGYKKVPMATLRHILTEVGFKDVKTYIQSGNIILQTLERNNLKVETIIKNTILDNFKFEVSVLVLSRQNLEHIFNNSPFPEDKKKSSYFMMLHDIPNDDLVKEASEKVYENEEYKIIDNCIYYYNENGFGKAKFNVNYFERKLKTFATARNYNTMVKLLSLSID